MERRITKEVKVGNVVIGGSAKISIQSMTDTSEYEATYAQMKSLEKAGCDIVRMAVPDEGAVRMLHRLKCSDITMPIVADIHFDYRLAMEAVEAGADKIRINPGNIGSRDRVGAVAALCKSHGIPIRVGVNSGSLEKELKEKYGATCAEALAESAMRNVRLLESFDFDNIVISAKSSDVRTMIEANEIIASQCAYPLHLGVTEAGSVGRGTIKGAIGIGALLVRGIGDTVRMSLTADPAEEIAAAKSVLEFCGAYSGNTINVVSCPTCGRTRIDLKSIVAAFEEKTKGLTPARPVKVAIMGCAVNGPGEASDADFGVAGGNGEALLFRHGEVVRKVPEDCIIDLLMEELGKYL